MAISCDSRGQGQAALADAIADARSGDGRQQRSFHAGPNAPAGQRSASVGAGTAPRHRLGLNRWSPVVRADGYAVALYVGGLLRKPLASVIAEPLRRQPVTESDLGDPAASWSVVSCAR